MKAFFLGTVWLVVLAAPANAGRYGALPALEPAVGEGRLTPADWQDPAMLPRQFRNHCTTESWSGRPYCSDHCGRGYQFYFCSRDSFGCCSVGYGYCDDRGHLRCRR